MRVSAAVMGWPLRERRCGVMWCCRGVGKNHPHPTLPLKGRALEAGLRGSDGGTSWRASVEQGVHAVDQSLRRAVAVDALGGVAWGEAAQEQVDGAARSEEHTSELQSIM